MGRRIVIIGGVACGPKAAARARRRDPEAEITIVEQGEHVSVGRCGIPYYVGGKVNDIEQLFSSSVGIVRDADFFQGVKNVRVLVKTRADRIDRARKQVHVTDLTTGATETLPYDKLVLSTGARPLRLNIPGVDLNRVHNMWSLSDAKAIRDAAWSGEVGHVVIIGAGLIGLEMAEALLEADIPGAKPEITVVEAMPHIAPSFLDPEMAALVTKHLEAKGLHIRTGELVQRLEGDETGAVRRVVTAQGTYPADLVVAAIGLAPNVDLAREAGLTIGVTGAIAVNQCLETSDPDIYAGGDCVENMSLINCRPVYTPQGSVANRHGRVIGNNLTGMRDVFPGVLGTVIFKVFDFTVGRTGLTESQARDSGHQVETAIVSGADHAHFYPGSGSVVVKLIVHVPTRRVLGAQLVGEGDVNKRLDALVVAATMKATVDHLANFDLAYAPPYNTAMDILHHAANTMRNKLAGLARTVTPVELKDRLASGDNLVVLDVRTQPETEERPAPYKGVTHIPLGQLRNSAGALSGDKTIVSFCQVSLRAWEAQRILEAEGLSNVRFLEGGLAAWPY
jgi:NADPH-dependent 2,4-dienoyl-CoA reductase/sulfur reductase-like enzyme/rhodanese-related sulfurtransferase